MGERKVLNKYYPPDFDPAKIPRRRQPKNQQMKVRMMLPMSIRCGTCGNYIYKGTKFNSRKEDVVVGLPGFGIPKECETYLGIQIFRFYFKCTKCSAEITFKTDPQNSDYIVESGASRNFEPWRAEDEETEEEKKKRMAEEMGDAMKSLENRTLDSKREMDILAALDEMKSMKSRHATVSVDAMLEALQRSNEQKERKLEEEDEALIKSVFKGQREATILRRIDDEDIDDDEDLDFFPPDNEGTSTGPSKRRKVTEENPSNPTDILTKDSVDGSNNRDNAGVRGASDNGKFIFKSSSVRVSIVKKSAADSNGNKGRKEETEKQIAQSTGVNEDKEKQNANSTGLLSLCQQYGSDEDE
ncbi:hypothetical protein DH2020_008464 [Rehmannia glutinosa]|uniref:Splicing factor YJU2 n=1 Tax=Rehmannia glutinosa TaxID=99300 RepID=A0ABR0X608_REHGL